jgi:histidyl-tRNA synthetase
MLLPQFMSSSHTTKTLTAIKEGAQQKEHREQGKTGRSAISPGRVVQGYTALEGRRRAKTVIEYRNIDPAVEVALYYGFTPLLSPLTITKRDRESARALEEQDKTELSSIAPTLEERIAMLRRYEEKNLHEGHQPAMFCAEILPGSAQKRKSDERRLALEIVGAEQSVAEATLIQTGLAALREHEHENLTLSINSVGDRESMNQFVRELGNFYRKRLPSIPQSCKTLLRKNPLDLLRCAHAECRAMAAEAPKSIGFLGDESRRHFREVLEFLEELEVPYKIDHTLSGNRVFATETIFEIWEGASDGVSRCLGSGVRYSNLGRRLGFKHDAPSVGLNLLLAREKRRSKKEGGTRFKRPLLFLLQLGFYAKMKSLRVIEMLRKARIPLYQALCRDKLISQISVAERLKLPYSLIVGQREALENSIIIRDSATRAQETVKLENLVEHLRKMKIG